MDRDESVLYITDWERKSLKKARRNPDVVIEGDRALCGGRSWLLCLSMMYGGGYERSPLQKSLDKSIARHTMRYFCEAGSYFAASIPRKNLTDMVYQLGFAFGRHLLRDFSGLKSWKYLKPYPIRVVHGPVAYTDRKSKSIILRNHKMYDLLACFIKDREFMPEMEYRFLVKIPDRIAENQLLVWWGGVDIVTFGWNNFECISSR